MTDLRRYFDEKADESVALLRQMVEIESPSGDKAGLDRMAAFVAGQAAAAGAEVTVVPQPVGNQVLARWQPGDGYVLLLAHMDTVCPVGTLAQRPIRIEDGRFYGPGAYDQKGGIAILLSALQGLRALGLRPSRPVLALFTSDEEVGSVASRALIEELAAQASVVFCTEPALPNGELKTWRKGVGDCRVVALGRAAHAGADHARGINAIEELAHQALALQALTDYARGTTVSVGRIQGGETSNVVPDRAELIADFRVLRLDDYRRLEAALHGLRPHLPGAQIEVTCDLNRPPMERTPHIAATFERVREIGARLGLALTETGTGGGSDANFTAALGVPTLDGMGVVGDNSHAIDEYAVVASLPERAALLAAVLAEW